MNAPAALRWDKPGPGAWIHDGAHSTGPVSRVVQDLFPDAMADGFRSFTARYGLPLSHIEVRYVNGFPYGSARIAGVPPSDRPPPPSWLLRVLTRAHPEMRRRNRQALVALDGRLWRDDLRRWFDELRPARVASVRALQQVDLDALDDAALATHVDACAAEFAAGLREHFSLVGASGLPVGLHVTREASRGRSPAVAIADLGGAAAHSTGATLPALRAIARALEDAGAKPTSLDGIRRASDDAARALDAYLDEYGQRIIGALDVTGRRLIELPQVVLRSVAAAGALTHNTTAPDHRTDTPDTVLGDARLAVASRDDHAGICCMWPAGLLRRALLTAASRLHAAGRLDDAAHVFDCTAREAAALLRRASGVPAGDELAARVAARQHHESIEPPRVLGDEHPPPNPALFPPGLRRASLAMAAFLGAMDSSHSDRKPGRGVGVGSAAYRGRAVVAVDPEDAIARLEPGDVLVTTTTTPAFNCVLPVAGALVTVHGGLMSHAGIAARELDIPAVLGVPDALDRITDGAEVEVDPVHGSVRLLA